jgi:hypothetical protein
MKDPHEAHPSTIKDDIASINRNVDFAGGFAGDDERREKERLEKERETRDAEKLATAQVEP